MKNRIDKVWSNMINFVFDIFFRTHYHYQLSYWNQYSLSRPLNRRHYIKKALRMYYITFTLATV